MNVKRLVPNIKHTSPETVQRFYSEIFELNTLMDLGWVITMGNAASAPLQLSIATEGGSGTDVPGLSIEVDDLEEALIRCQKAEIPIEYGPVDEPWGVRRFFIRDPSGTLLNVLTHSS